MANDQRGVWSLSAVWSLEVVRISEVKMHAAIGRGGGVSVLRRLSASLECPLSEVPLYIHVYL